MRRVSRVGFNLVRGTRTRSVRTQLESRRGFSSGSYGIGNFARRNAAWMTAGTLTAGGLTALWWENQSKNSFYADSEGTGDENEPSKEMKEKMSRKLAKQKLPDPTRAILYVSPDGKWTVYGTKDCLRLVNDEITKKIKKRGYGWSGCAASQTANHFWLVADSEKKFLFRVNFKSGTVSRITLDKDTKLTDMEAVSSVPQNAVDDPRYEELFLVCSSSTNAATKNTPKSERCRIAFVQIPVQECHRESPISKALEEAQAKKRGKVEKADKDHKEDPKFEAFTEGVDQFTAQDMRSHIMELILTKYATQIDTSPELISKEGGLDIEGACFFPAKSNTENHRLFLGLRGPLTKDGRACIIELQIPRAAKRDPAQWKISNDISMVDLKGFGIRDMCLSLDQKHVYLLAGSLGQDKTNLDLSEYPVYQWKAGTEIVEQIGAVPRFKAGDLNHTGLSATAWEEYGMKEGDLPADEVPGNWSSPEGLDVYRNKYGQERVLCVWDNNDVGCYAEIAMKDFRREAKQDRVEGGGRERRGRRREEKGGRREEEKGGRREEKRGRRREERAERRVDRMRDEEEHRDYDRRRGASSRTGESQSRGQGNNRERN